MATFDTRDLLGKIIYTRKPVEAYWQFPLNPKDKFTIGRNEPVGVLYSVINFKDTGVVWFLFKSSNMYHLKNDWKYFVAYKPQDFDINKLIEQGVPDLKEKGKQAKLEREKEEKGAFAYYFERYGKAVLLTAGAVAATYLGIRAYASTRSQPKG